MVRRIDYYSVNPEFVNTLIEAGNLLSGISPGMKSMLQLHASEINGCAFCVDIHYQEALDAGLEDRKLRLLPAWREAPDFFTESERAALEYAERVTSQNRNGIDDQLFDTLKDHFTDEEIVDMTYAVALINAFNRIAVPLQAGPDR